MANAAGMINEGLWRKDRDFQRLPRLAQCTFCQVLSQKDLDTAGVLTLNVELLAKACDELTVEQLRADFAVLERARFLFVDYDTDELLVRSYVRLVSARSGPKGKSLSWHSVPKNARLLGSEKLRRELAGELRRIGWVDSVALADEIDPLPSPSEPPPKPLARPSENGSPLQAPSKPHRQGLDLVQVSPTVVGSVGVQRARPTCPKHEQDSDQNCRACMRRRLWDQEHATVVEANQLDAKRRAREAERDAIRMCPFCDNNGLREVGDDLTVRCDHPGPCGRLSLMGSPCERIAGHTGPHLKTNPDDRRQTHEWTDESNAAFADKWGSLGT